MQKTKTKLKGLIITLVCVSLAVICAVSVLLVGKLQLSNAIKKMDITQKETVTRVIKLCKNDVDILTDIANEYIKKGADEGAGIFMHILQNIDCENESAKALLKEYYTSVGADPIFINQVDFAKILNTEFDTLTSYGDVSYGGVDGIYCSDFEGFITFKISGARAKSMSAYDKGVYFLDYSDNCVKTLSYDGAKAEVVLQNTAEFVYFDNIVYSIDLDGNLHSLDKVTKKEGEVFGSLRVADGSVLCNVYNEKRELIDTLTLN